MQPDFRKKVTSGFQFEQENMTEQSQDLTVCVAVGLYPKKS
jgi:hypothetical protein